MYVREVHDDDRPWALRTLREHWGDEIVVGRGRVRKSAELDALVAIDKSGERVGLATYVVEGAVAELVTLDALQAGAGVGRQLPDAVSAAVRAARVRRL